MLTRLTICGGICLAVANTAMAQVPSSSASDALKKMTVDQLLELEVTSVSKRGERLRDAPASVYVLSSDDIRRSGATTLVEALRLAPNLEVAQIDSVQYAVSARGFNNAVGNKLLVLVDGRTIYTPLFSGVFWDQQFVMLEDVERIEIVSGPGGTLWGANAVNGVINIITKSAADTQGTLVAGTVGDREGNFVARWGGRVKSSAVRAYAKFTSLDGAPRPVGPDIPNGWRRGQVGARADWEGGVDALTIQGDAYLGESDHRGLVGGLDVPAIEVSGLNVLGRWRRQLQGGSAIQLQSYVDRSSRDEFVIFRPHATIFDIDFHHNIPWGSHRLLWGGGYRHGSDRNDDAFFARFIPSERDLNWQNVFAQGEFRLSPRVATTLGTKLERNDFTGVEYLPSARVSWNISDTHLLWGAASRAVRAPSRFDRDVFVPVEPPFIVAGGPDFQSEVANVYEIGLRAQPSASISYSATVFTHLWDKLRSGTSVPVQLENKIDGTVKGVEFWATYQPLPFWTLDAGATILREDLRLKPGSTDPAGVDNPTLRNDPDHHWTLRSSLDLARNVGVDVHLRGVGALPNPRVPAYTEMGLRLEWRPHPRVELSVAGHDLLHDTHPEFGATGERNEISRRVSGRMAWTF